MSLSCISCFRYVPLLPNRGTRSTTSCTRWEPIQVILQRWTALIGARPAVKRGRMVNRLFGDPAGQLRERHEASDFDTKTQDKVAVTK
jgi:hypothetical protein